MSNFFVRGLALMFTGLALVVILPMLAQLFFTLGPVGFVIAVFVFLGVGAMFVRSLTIFLVEKGTLSEYRYLEHGAFYAIGSLAIIMFMGTIQHIPEIITGLIGAIFIGLSLWSSIQFNTQEKNGR